MSKVSKIKGLKSGIYRDDVLGVSYLPKREIEHQIKKKLVKIFGENDLKIIVEAPVKKENFLNVNLDLNTGRYKLYRKPNNELVYVCKDSNHPKNIIKEIPLGIERMINSLSSTENDFNEVVGDYREALKKCGYETKLEYKGKDNIKKEGERKEKEIGRKKLHG